MSEHRIKKVELGSIAEELEIEAGDILLSINDEEVEDIFDYRFLIKDKYYLTKQKTYYQMMIGQL